MHLKQGLAFALLISVFGASAFAEEYTLKYGQLVPLVVKSSITSEGNSEGEMIALEVERDVLAKDGKTVLIKRGAPAKAFVTKLEQRDKMGEGGKVTVTVKMTNAIDGTAVPLFGTVANTGKDKDVSTRVFWLGYWGTLAKGEGASIAAGTSVDAYVDAETTVAIKTDAPANKTQTVLLEQGPEVK